MVEGFGFMVPDFKQIIFNGCDTRPPVLGLRA